jgi:hypothetical protein
MAVRVTVETSGLREMQASLDRAIADLPLAGQAELAEGAIAVFAASEAVVPRDKGGLAATGRITPIEGGYEVAYGGGPISYAAITHWAQRTRHGDRRYPYTIHPPGEHAWLWRTGARLGPGIQRRVIAAVERAARGEL